MSESNNSTIREALKAAEEWIAEDGTCGPQGLGLICMLQDAQELIPEIKPLSEEDLNSIQYFVIDKGDVTRMSGWEKLEPSFKHYYPRHYEAMMRLRTAETDVDQLFKDLI